MVFPGQLEEQVQFTELDFLPGPDLDGHEHALTRAVLLVIGVMDLRAMAFVVAAIASSV